MQRGVSLGRALLVLAIAADARAICDVIPSVKNEFRSVEGSLSRPYASPGDTVEVALDGSCDVGGPFVAPGPTQDNLVTIVFKPPKGPASAVVITADPAACAAAANACQLELGGTAVCGSGSAITVTEKRTCVGGPVADRSCRSSAECGGAARARRGAASAFLLRLPEHRPAGERHVRPAHADRSGPDRGDEHQPGEPGDAVRGARGGAVPDRDLRGAVSPASTGSSASTGRARRRRPESIRSSVTSWRCPCPTTSRRCAGTPLHPPRTRRTLRPRRHAARPRRREPAPRPLSVPRRGAGPPAPGEAAGVGAVRALAADVLDAVAAGSALPIPAEDVALALRVSIATNDHLPHDLLAMKQQVLAADPPAFCVTGCPVPCPSCGVAARTGSVAAIVTGLWEAPDP